MYAYKLALIIIEECGADCVKFQKTCLNEKFTKQTLDTPYNNENSWGKTYGEHKAFLEFSEEQFMDLKAYAEQIGILFLATPMDPISLEFLVSLNVPLIKIGSGDADNLLLIEKAAATKIPLIISTGMQSMESVKKIYKTVKKYHSNFALLHCVSSYPTPPSEANLRVITSYRETFPDIVIGYSGHEENYNLTLAAVALEAKIIERHITLDKTWKGSDHKCSLTPSSLKDTVNGIREIEKALGTSVKQVQLSEQECINKLGKTLVAAKYLPQGYKIERSDIKAKVARLKGISPNDIYRVIGKKVKNSLLKDQIIDDDDLEL